MGAGLATVTLATPIATRSAAVIAACNSVLETNVVVRALPFHCTVEELTKLFPVTVSVKLAPPAIAEPGFSNVIAGGGPLIVNARELEIPPPGAGLDTVTMGAPTTLMSAAVIAACKLVLETNVVVRALPFHCTVEDGTKLVPVTVNVKPAPPVKAELGFKEVIVGAGLLIVKFRALETPPPGAGLETVTIAVPPVAMSAAVMAACKLVLDTNVVVRALPFHCTVEEDTKPVPVTVSVNAAPPAIVELMFRDSTAGAGLLIVKANALLEPPPGLGVETETCAVPAAAMSAAVMAACKLVLDTNVVVRAFPFHCTVEEDTKLVPVTVRVNAAPPATTELGLKEPLASDGVGLFGGGGGLL